jgi:uncharacterized membrane protein YpjA
MWFGQTSLHFQQLVAAPPLLALVLALNVAAYFAGLLFWYGPVMADPTTPVWAWPFIPDCPLFGLLGGLGLLMVTAQRQWHQEAVVQGQRWLWLVGGVSLVVWLSTYLPGAPVGWRGQAAMWALWSWALLIGAVWFRRPPVWLLGIFAFGQIKYGIWTITAWLLYWQSTAELLGAPHFSADSVFMTITHIGLLAQGIFLLTYFRPTVAAAVTALLWFAASDFVDYGLGYHPAIPEQFISLTVIQWSTIAVTWLLGGLYLLLALRRVKRGTAVTGAEQASQFA